VWRFLVVVIVCTLLVLVYALFAPNSKAFFDEQSRVGSSKNTVSMNSQTTPLLQAARNIDPNPARGGGDLTVVEGTALAADSSPFKNEDSAVKYHAEPEQISLYLVREGDTLSQVATMFNVSVSTIVWANNLRSSKDIHPGETLLILPVSGVQYTVRAGDTIESVAAKYGGDVDEMIAYNDLSAQGLLVAGSTITIPGGEVPVLQATKKEVAATKNSNTKGYFIHPVPQGVRTQGIHGYNGVDIAASAGTAIRAAAAGQVIVSRAGGWNGGYGNYIVISHPNGTQTLYAHNTENIVPQGAQVAAGQVIAYVGSTGRSTGNHLHFEVRGGKNPF
jgi:LysM repeat protein